jgi:hypothetical protein
MSSERKRCVHGWPEGHFAGPCIQCASSPEPEPTAEACPHLHVEEQFYRADPLDLVAPYLNRWWCHDCEREVQREPEPVAAKPWNGASGLYLPTSATPPVAGEREPDVYELLLGLVGLSGPCERTALGDCGFHNTDWPCPYEQAKQLLARRTARLRAPVAGEQERFEVWLRSECFQAPPEDAVTLARSAWLAALHAPVAGERERLVPIRARSRAELDAARAEWMESETAMARGYEEWRKDGDTPAECLDRATHATRNAFTAGWRANAARLRASVQSEALREARQWITTIAESACNSTCPCCEMDARLARKALTALGRTLLSSPEGAEPRDTVGELCETLEEIRAAGMDPFEQGWNAALTCVRQQIKARARASLAPPVEGG